MSIVKELWKIVDRLELMVEPNFFDEVAKANELNKILRDLKELINNLK